MRALMLAALAVAGTALRAEELPAPLIRWTDLRGVLHLTSTPPAEHEVSRDEWLRLKAEYGDVVREQAPPMAEDEKDLPPGARAERAVADWWNIAGPRGGFRGHAHVSPEEKAEMDRLLAVARDALKQARGTDLSPAAGRAAADLRRAQMVDVAVKDPASRIPVENLYPVSITGRMVRGPRDARYDVQARVSNRTVRDTPPLLVTFFLEKAGLLIATREATVRGIMARGEAPVQVVFDLSPGMAAGGDELFAVRAEVVVEGRGSLP